MKKYSKKLLGNFKRIGVLLKLQTYRYRVVKVDEAHFENLNLFDDATV